MDRLGPPGNAKKPRLGRTVDVGIQDTNLKTDRLQAKRQIAGGRRLADTALARGDGDDVLDARHASDLILRRFARGLLLAGGHRRRYVAALFYAGGQRGAGWGTTSIGGCRDRRPIATLGVGRQRHHDLVDTLDLAHDFLGRLTHWFEFLGPAGVDGDRKEHLAVINHDVGHDAGCDEVSLQVGALHAAQRFEHGVFRRR